MANGIRIRVCMDPRRPLTLHEAGLPLFACLELQCSKVKAEKAHWTVRKTETAICVSLFWQFYLSIAVLKCIPLPHIHIWARVQVSCWISAQVQRGCHTSKSLTMRFVPTYNQWQGVTPSQYKNIHHASQNFLLGLTCSKS